VRPARPQLPRIASATATPAAPVRCSCGRRRGWPATKAAAIASNAATETHAAADGTAPPSRPATTLASVSRSGAGHAEPPAQSPWSPAMPTRVTAADRCDIVETFTAPASHSAVRARGNNLILRRDGAPSRSRPPKGETAQRPRYRATRRRRSPL